MATESSPDEIGHLLAVGSLDIQCCTDLLTASIPTAFDGWFPIPSDLTSPSPFFQPIIQALQHLVAITALQATCHPITNSNDWLRVRIYLIPFEADKSSSNRCTQLTKSSLYKILEKIDKRPEIFEVAEYLNLEPELLLDDENCDSLLSIYLDLPSPNPFTEELSENEVQMVKHFLEQPGPSGLKTELYRYQRNTLCKMLQRERENRKIVHPRLTKFQTVHGTTFYFDLVDFVATLHPSYYPDTRGGIICEDMGTGKTCICIALILATKYEIDLPAKSPLTSDIRCDILSPPGRMHSLMLLAANSAICAGVPFKKGGLPRHIHSMLDGHYPPYYMVYSLPSLRECSRQAAKEPYPVFISGATLVVVPQTLIEQWVNEINKHIDDLALNILVISKMSQSIPEPKFLLRYDVVLITFNRFAREMDFNSSPFTERLITCKCDDEKALHCPLHDAYLSPLLRVHWKRLIVDEGSILGNNTSRTSDLAACLHASRRWCCTGTPTHNLAASDTSVSRMANEGGDLTRLWGIIGNFLGFAPFRERRKEWNRAITKPFIHRHLGAVRRVRDLMTNLMIRTQREDIERDVRLPPLNERIVLLNLDYYQYITHNCLIAFIAANAVLSQRTDQDYFFHPRQRKALAEVIHNLWNSCFWLTASPHENLHGALSNVEQGLARASHLGYSDEDVILLKRAKWILEHAIKDSVWRGLSETRSMGYFVKGLRRDVVEARGVADMERIQKFSGLAFNGEEEDDIEVEDDDDVCLMCGEELSHLVRKLRSVKPPSDMIPLETKDIFVRYVQPNENNRGRKRARKTLKIKETATTKEKRRGDLHAKGNITVGSETVVQNQNENSHQSLIVDSGKAQTPEKRSNSKDPSKKASPIKKDHQNDPTISPTSILPADGVVPAISSSPHYAPIMMADFRSSRVVATTSSKLNYLIDQIHRHTPNEKVIIFTQFNNEMYFLSEAFTLAGIPHLLYHNRGIKADERAHNIVTFQTSSQISVIIMDTKLAAFGINLPAATRVYFTAPVLQSAVERQAIKRAHRIGQTRPVYVETLVARGTLEEAILRRKREMSAEEGARVRDVEDDGKLRAMLSAAQFVPGHPNNEAEVYSEEVGGNETTNENTSTLNEETPEKVKNMYGGVGAMRAASLTNSNEIDDVKDYFALLGSVSSLYQPLFLLDRKSNSSQSIGVQTTAKNNTETLMDSVDVDDDDEKLRLANDIPDLEIYKRELLVETSTGKNSSDIICETGAPAVSRQKKRVRFQDEEEDDPDV
ncbi:uncharacterized protein VTP21DRAFT_7825 [Calcarisporiella thermophila]|uniref:uncharacterized protein n=1 Tax=Calcarisporiella thermophila TaxID=911321 RepID=UPI0037426BEE